MPKIAHVDTETATDTKERGSAMLTKIARAREQGQDVARTDSERAWETATDAATDSRKTLQRSAGDTAEFGRTMIDLLGEQTRHNLQTATALARAVNWTGIADTQRAFIGDSVERMNRLGEQYRAMLQAGMKTMSFPARH